MLTVVEGACRGGDNNWIDGYLYLIDILYLISISFLTLFQNYSNLGQSQKLFLKFVKPVLQFALLMFEASYRGGV